MNPEPIRAVAPGNSDLQDNTEEEEEEEESSAGEIPNNSSSTNNGEVPNDVMATDKPAEAGERGNAEEGADAVADRNQQKPPFSYAQLIVQALLASKDRRQTLSSIYTFIAEMYPYYKLEEKGWKVCSPVGGQSVGLSTSVLRGVTKRVSRASKVTEIVMLRFALGLMTPLSKLNTVDSL